MGVGRSIQRGTSIDQVTDARSKRPPLAPPPTIGDLRHQGVTRFRLSCNEVNCAHGADLAIDTLDLPDDTPFPSIATQRRWKCEKCGSRKVSVMPRWPYLITAATLSPKIILRTALGEVIY